MSDTVVPTPVLVALVAVGGLAIIGVALAVGASAKGQAAVDVSTGSLVESRATASKGLWATIGGFFSGLFSGAKEPLKPAAPNASTGMTFEPAGGWTFA